MSKRRDAALKRAIKRAWDEPADAPSEVIANIYVAMLRFVRRERAEAWDEGARGLLLGPAKFREAHAAFVKTNPYRGRARR